MTEGLFGDSHTAQEILNSSSPEEQKRLGRKVANFQEDVWNAQCPFIVREGNMLKVFNFHIMKLLDQHS